MYIVTRNDVVVKSTIVKVRLLLGYSDFPGNLVMNGRESRVYHWVPRRIEAHIALTYLAFALLRHLQHRVAVRQNAVMSARAIRTALLDVQSTLMKDGETGKLYRFPKAMSESARKIYRSLGLVRGLGNTEILSVRKYRNRKGIRSAGTDGDGTMEEEGTGGN